MNIVILGSFNPHHIKKYWTEAPHSKHASIRFSWIATSEDLGTRNTVLHSGRYAICWTIYGVSYNTVRNVSFIR